MPNPATNTAKNCNYCFLKYVYIKTQIQFTKCISFYCSQLSFFIIIQYFLFSISVQSSKEVQTDNQSRIHSLPGCRPAPGKKSILIPLYIYTVQCTLFNIAAYISLYLFIYCNIQHYIYLYISLCTIFISLYTVSVYLLFHLVIFPFVYLTLFSLSDLIFSVRPYFLYPTLFSLNDLIFSIRPYFLYLTLFSLFDLIFSF